MENEKAKIMFSKAVRLTDKELAKVKGGITGVLYNCKKCEAQKVLTESGFVVTERGNADCTHEWEEY